MSDIRNAGDAGSETPEFEFEDAGALTKNETPPSFNRGKVLKIAGGSLAAIILFAFVFNSVNERKKNSKQAVSGAASVSVPDFLKRERDNALKPENLNAGADGDADGDLLPSVEQVSLSGLPEVKTVDELAGRTEYGDGIPKTVPPSGAYPPPEQRYAGGGGGAAANVRNPQHSPLIPAVEGTLFNTDGYRPQAYPPQTGPYDDYTRGTAAPAAQDAYYRYPEQPPQAYRTQNMQDDKKNFYNGPDNAVTGRNGYFLGDNVIWTGTIIPAVLVTGINTDLPGDVVARITGNVYDSRTGQNLLLPQGTILIARYNSSVSYAQSRIQIVWNYLIRPDGYMFDLEGANGVDLKGLSGQQGAYHENWFQYLKAAGIITMFTLANSRLTEIAGVKLSEDTAQANAQLTAQLGSNIVGRALDIQPTITLGGGEKINVLLNKPVYLPPLGDYPVTEIYTGR